MESFKEQNDELLQNIEQNNKQIQKDKDEIDKLKEQMTK